VQGFTSVVDLDDVLTDIKTWINTQPNLTVSQLVLTVDPNCPTSLDSFESEDCTITDQSMSDNALPIAIISGTILAAALVIIVAIIIVVVMWCYKQRLIRRYSVVLFLHHILLLIKRVIYNLQQFNHTVQ